MTLLFGDESVRPIAVVKPVSSSFFSLLVHFAVIAVLLAINFSAGVLKLPQNLHATLLVAPAPPLAPPPARRRRRDASGASNAVQVCASGHGRDSETSSNSGIGDRRRPAGA